MAGDRYNVDALLSWLRSIYGAEKGPASAHAVALIVWGVAEQARALRAEVAADVFVERGLTSWDAELAGLQARFADWYWPRLAEGLHIVVADGLLDGEWPPSLANTDVPDVTQGLRLVEAAGHGGVTLTRFEGMADAALAASLVNQALEVVELTDELGGTLTEGFRDVVSSAMVELGETAAPGEDPTLRDELANRVNAGVDDALDDIMGAIGDAVGFVLKGAALLGGGALAYVGIRRLMKA